MASATASGAAMSGTEGQAALAGSVALHAASSVEDMCWAIARLCFEKRLRLRAFFTDYDPLRSGRVTRGQFLRALDLATIRLSSEQQQALADAYTDHATAEVSYTALCTQVDRVFVEPELEKQPHTEPWPAGSMLAPSFVPVQLGEAEQREVEAVLHRTALLLRTRGLVLKACFRDFERSCMATASIRKAAVNCVTESQFRRCFPFTSHFSDRELALLVARYRTADGDVNYRALHEDVSEIDLANPAPAFQSSPLDLRPDGRQWSNDGLEAEHLVQARAVERRLRLRDYFLDFDPLRKGYCALPKLDTVLGILGIELRPAEVQQLQDKYLREDGMFHYAPFCDTVEAAFTVKGLEHHPEVRIAMPDATTTEPARRNCLVLTDEEAAEVERIEDDIRARVRTRHVTLLPWFHAFDRSCSFAPLKGHPQHVSKSQLARVMSSLGFELSERAVTLLARKYCDKGNLSEVNYGELCRSVEAEEMAANQTAARTAAATAAAPAQPRASRYFNADGSIQAYTGPVEGAPPGVTA